jgi:hypothetical protein
MVALSPVNVPPELKVRILRVKEVFGKVKAVVPKSILLKKLVLVIVCTAVPDPVNVKLTPLAIVPAVEAHLNVLVISAAAVKPPVPVKVKPVAVAISRLTVPAVVIANTILPEPNAILRVLELLEANVPVVSVNPPRAKAPFVKVVAAVAPIVNALPRVQPPPTPLNVIEGVSVTPLVVIVRPVVVEENVTVPVALHTVLDTNDILPATARVPVEAKVTVPADTVISKQFSAPVMVTV